MQVLKKITIKAVYGDIKLPAVIAHSQATKGQPMFLMRIVGSADRVITRKSPYSSEAGEGLSYGLAGMFRATSAEGEIFQSTVAFLPDVITAQLRMALEADNAEAVEFAFDIGAIVSPRDGNKYEFVVKPLLDVAIADPLKALSDRIASQVALPGPAKASPPAEAPRKRTR